MKSTNFLFSSLLFLLSTLSVLRCASVSAVSKRDITAVTIYTPPSNYVKERTLYARQVMLQDGKGTLLTTWENYTPSGVKPYFPVYRSTDHGYTWSKLSQVEDTVNGWGLRYQPFLYVLQNAYGGFAKGTLLCAGNSIPEDLSETKIDVYASTDGGASWTFVSSVARGGKALPNNGETPVWEPFILEYDGKIVLYYSDQRDPAYGQKLVHVTSTDLHAWSAIVDDVVTPGDYGARPGMAVVDKLPNGQYILTYEFGGAPEANFAVYYRLSNDPTKFASAQGQVLRTTDGTVFTSSPYVIWTPAGGANGAIVVSAASTTDLMVNRALGDPTQWTRLTVPGTTNTYSRSLAVGFNPKDITVADGGALNQGATNKVVFSARDVNGCATCS